MFCPRVAHQYAAMLDHYQSPFLKTEWIGYFFPELNTFKTPPDFGKALFPDPRLTGTVKEFL